MDIFNAVRLGTATDLAAALTAGENLNQHDKRGIYTASLGFGWATSD